MAYPITDPALLSDATTAFLHELATGDMQRAAQDTSMFIDGWFDSKPIVGGDTISIAMASKVGITSMTRSGSGSSTAFGNAPPVQKIYDGKITLKTDTMLLIRVPFSLLEDYTSQYDMKGTAVSEQGIALGRQFDIAMFTMLIKGALATKSDSTPNASRTLPSEDAGYNDGFHTELASGDDVDGSAIYEAISNMIISMKKAEVFSRIKEPKIFLDQGTLNLILEAKPNLVNKDVSDGNGDYAQGILARIGGVPLVVTNLIPDAEITSPLGSSFDLTDGVETNALAIIGGRNSLLVGETIPMTFSSFYDQVTFTHYYDVIQMYTATYYRPDYCGVITRYVAP